MPKKKSTAAATAVAQVNPESNGQVAAAEQQTTVANSASDATADEVDLQNADELAKAKAEIKSLQDRLSFLTQADQLIIQAELEATRATDALAEADAARKKAKKEADNKLEHLRQVVRDRMTGQQNLLDWASKKTESGAPISNEPATTGATGATATTKPSGEDDERPTADVKPAPTGADPTFDVRIGSISIKGDGEGEMISVPPGIVASLEEAGLTTVRQVWDLIVKKDLNVKGIGKAKLDTLESTLKLWVKEAGTDRAKFSEPVAASPADAPQTAPEPAPVEPAEPVGQSNQQEPAKPKAEPTVVATNAHKTEAGEATHRCCGTCNARWPLPSPHVKCGECGEEDLIYEVGYYGESACDDQGDFVVGNEQLLILVPKTDKLPGVEQYGFNVLLSKGSDGLYRNGWEILFNNTPDENDTQVSAARYPSICRGYATDRATAIQLAFGDLKREFRNMVIQEPKVLVWVEAVKAKLFGLEPLDKAPEPNHEATPSEGSTAPAATAT